MVDAVNAINAATNIKVKQQQDITKDWKSMTANEVLEHAGKGEEVPLEVLQWAEDYSKMTNVPDDVSYDAVNGETNSDKVREEAGTSDIKNAEENAEETDTKEAEDEPKEQEMSLYDQAGILIPESQAASSTVDDMNTDIEHKVNESEEVTETANQKAEQAENNTSSTKAEYDSLLNRLQGDKSKINPADLLKLDKLSQRLINVGTRAQNELSVYDIQLQEIEQVFSQYEPTPPAATEKGEETIEVGEKLIAETPESTDEVNTSATANTLNINTKFAFQKTHHARWAFMFDRNYIMGQRAIEAGNNAIDSGSNGESVLAEAQPKIDEAGTVVNNSEDKVEDATMVEGNNIQISNKSEDKSASDRAKKPEETKNSAANKTELNGVKDTNIQANDLELQKRKERRGEYEAT
ncbi:hypothetical protein IKP85_04275 [bacterium]|nr:hypothetical protein [bacterium]